MSWNEVKPSFMHANQGSGPWKAASGHVLGFFTPQAQTPMYSKHYPPIRHVFDYLEAKIPLF